jgi:hypothetical protein
VGEDMTDSGQPEYPPLGPICGALLGVLPGMTATALLLLGGGDLGWFCVLATVTPGLAIVGAAAGPACGPGPRSPTANRPRAAGEVPPWERPGCCRRDWEPHRGPFLLRLAVPGALLAQWALVLAASFAWTHAWRHLSVLVGSLEDFCVVMALASGLGGLAAGVTAWMLAQEDLERMRGGLVDPRGQAPTRYARCAGVVAVVLAALFLVLCLSLWVRPTLGRNPPRPGPPAGGCFGASLPADSEGGPFGVR